MFKYKKILTLFEVFGISDFSKLVALKESIEEFDVYYYLIHEININFLVKDTVNYFLNLREKAGNRRICFLIPDNQDNLSALIIECSSLDPEMVSQWKELAYHGSQYEEKNLEIIKRIYNKVKCWLVGDLFFNPETVCLYQKYLQEAYFSRDLIIQPLAVQNNDIVFIECLRQLLNFGEIKQIDVDSCLSNYQRHCAEALAERWIGLKTTEPQVYIKIIKYINILVKYHALKTIRDRYSLNQASIEKLEAIAVRYGYEKNYIYQQNFPDITDFLRQSPLLVLIQLLQCSSTTELLDMLNENRNEQLADLKKWEIHLEQFIAEYKKSWANYLPWIGKKSLSMCYQHTLVGLGTELSAWLSSKVTEKEITINAFKYIGAGLGLSCNYYFGSYFFLKSLLIGKLGSTLKDQFSKSTINDEQAEIMNPQKHSSDGTEFYRLANLLFALMESLYGKTIQPLVHTSGGIIGSASLVALAKRFFSDVYSLQQPTTQNQLFSLFFLSMLGYDISVIIADLGYHGVDKLIARNDLHENFCGTLNPNHFMGCVSDFSSQSHWSPAFWLKNDDEVRLGWTNKTGFNEASCTVIKLVSGERSVTCDQPVNLLRAITPHR